MGCCCKKKQSNEDMTDNNDGDSNLIPDSMRTSTINSSISSLNSHLNDFDRLKVLGRGTFAKVILVRSTLTNEFFAMKILKKKDVVQKKQLNHTKTERALLEKLSNPFIVKLQYAFQDKKRLYFLTEFMQGGELFFHLQKNGLYKDPEVIFYTSEIICAIEYMHNNNFIYRDLKPENILIDKYGHIKITDFGLSKILERDKERAFTLCGTPQYLAPEILLGKGYDKSCDWFSLGVLIFEMLCGFHPFPNIGKQIDLKIYFRPLNFPKLLSVQARDIIMKLIDPNPKHRLGVNGADEIKQHKFFQGIDFEMVKEKKYQPPFVPKLRGHADLTYFSHEFINERVESLPKNDNVLSQPNNDLFVGFSFQPNKSPPPN